MSQRPPWWRALLLAGLAALAGLLGVRILRPGGGDRPLVFAASSLTEFLIEADEFYQLDQGREVDLHFHASALLRRQIETGGGADLFISASPDEVDALEASGLVLARAPVARNRLVLVEREAREGWQERLLEGARVLEREDLGTLAIGEPETVPAGRYAREAMESLGVWDRIGPAAVRGTNVRQVLEYVRRGQADVGIVYRTDPRAGDGLRTIHVFAEETHSPILYVGAVVAGGRHPEKARAFLDWLSKPERNGLLRKHGFLVPE